MVTYTADNSIIEKAKVTDPIPYLQQAGCYVYQPSSQNTAYVYYNGFTKKGEEDIRVTLKTDRNWISCFHDNTPIGSNINLALIIHPSLNVVEAAKQLCEAAGVDTNPYFRNWRFASKCGPSAPSSVTGYGHKRNWPPLQNNCRPVLPAEAGIENGIDYLKRRGISDETIEFARRANFLKFVNDGIIYCGYDDDGVLRCASKRSTTFNVDDHEIKRDLRWSLKAYAPLLPGNSEVVWIVEGGMDALALRDIAKRKCINPPVVIVTGGRNTKTWTDNPILQNKLRSAKRCYICLEGDPGEEFLKTKSSIESQRDLILEKTGVEVTIWPHDGHWIAGCKDIADFNLKQQVGAGKQSLPSS